MSALEIFKGNLDIKVPLGNNKDINDLCNAFDMMREELLLSRQRQLKFDTERKELIANLSHDLRTPIASIKAYLIGLQTGIADNSQKVHKYLTVINKKTDSLIKLLDDLYFHSINELGKLNIQKKEIYSREYFKSVLDCINVQFENSSQKFYLEDNIPNVLIKIDPIRIEQVILNLVDNAKKYSRENSSKTKNNQ